MTEQELLALYEQRGQRVIQEAEVAYGHYPFRMAGAVPSSRESVEEYLDDTWPWAWNSIPPEKPKYFHAYLNRIVKNLALSLLWKQYAERRCGKQYQLALDEFDKDALPTGGSTEEATDKNRLAACIDRFLEELLKT